MVQTPGNIHEVIDVLARLHTIRKELDSMAATISSILVNIGAINDEIQVIRTFIASNPVATQAQLQQISDNLGTVKGNLDGLENQVGIPVTPPPPTPTAKA